MEDNKTRKPQVVQLFVNFRESRMVIYLHPIVEVTRCLDQTAFVYTTSNATCNPHLETYDE